MLHKFNNFCHSKRPRSSLQSHQLCKNTVPGKEFDQTSIAAWEYCTMGVAQPLPSHSRTRSKELLLLPYALGYGDPKWNLLWLEMWRNHELVVSKWRDRLVSPWLGELILLCNFIIYFKVFCLFLSFSILNVTLAFRSRLPFNKKTSSFGLIQRSYHHRQVCIFFCTWCIRKKKQSSRWTVIKEIVQTIRDPWFWKSFNVHWIWNQQVIGWPTQSMLHSKKSK